MTIAKYSLALGLSALALSVQAQNTNFTGATLGGNIVLQDNKIDYGGDLNGRTSKDTNVAFQLDAAYGIALGQTWVATIGATYDINKSDYGSLNYQDGNRTETVKVKAKDHWSVYLAPGYAINNNWLVYGKVAYHQFKGEFTDTAMPSGTTKHNGYGLGAGTSYAVTPNFLVSGEVQHISLDRATGNNSNGKPSSTQLTMKAAYRF